MRDQLDRLDDLASRETDSKVLKEYADATTRLSEQERVLDGSAIAWYDAAQCHKGNGGWPVHEQQSRCRPCLSLSPSRPSHRLPFPAWRT